MARPAAVERTKPEATLRHLAIHGLPKTDAPVLDGFGRIEAWHPDFDRALRDGRFVDRMPPDLPELLQRRSRAVGSSLIENQRGGLGP